MGLQGVECPVISVPRNCQKSRFQMPAVQAAVVGAETIYHRFQLGAHTVVVERSCKDNHIGSQKPLADHLNVILLDTRALVSALHAADAGMNIRMTDVNNLYRMACLFSASCKVFNQNTRRTFSVRASHQYSDLHQNLLIIIYRNRSISFRCG